MTRAFYIAPPDLRLPNGDGRAIVVGETLEVAGPLSLCSLGLHASEHVLDAAGYRGVGCLTLVELSGDIVEGDDKLCATRRKTLAILSEKETARVLRLITCCAAEMAIGWSGEEPDQRSVDAIDCARRFAEGRASQAELTAAARAAAWAAERDAAWDALHDMADRMALEALGVRR